MKKDEKLTYSKWIVIMTGLIFVACISIVFFIFLADRVDSMIDVGILGTCVTVTGTIFGSNLCWYSKKAAGENNYKLRISLYKESADVRINYNEKMMQLMKKYNVSEMDLSNIDANSDIKEMMDDALSDTINNLDMNRDDAASLNEVENM